MSTDLVVQDKQSIFTLLDSEDERQIVNVADFSKDETLVYQVHNSSHLSYKGIKHIAFVMGDHGMALKTTESKLDVLGEEEEKTWYATVNVTNTKTGQEAQGLSECPFYENGRVDHFARTKAHSKAERNAIRKLIPEYMITKFIDDAKKKGQTKTLQGTVTFCKCNPSAPNPQAKEICLNCTKVIKHDGFD